MGAGGYRRRTWVRRRLRIPARTPRHGTPLILAVAAALALSRDPASRRTRDHDHADEEPPAARSPQTDAPRRLPDGDVFLPKPSQRLLHVRTLVAKREAARQGRELIGTVVPDPSTFGQVQAPMDGRIELAERGISHVGQHVEAGEVLAYLSPSIPIADLGTMQQLTAEVDGKLQASPSRSSRA